MKIAIDCADLDHQRIDGTRVYIKNLLTYFGKLDCQSKFLLYHQKKFNPILEPPFFPNYTERKVPYSFWWTQTRLAFELKKDSVDALWMPIQQLPYLVEKNGFRKIVTIHDLAFKFFPKHFTPVDRFKLNLFTDYAVKNADRIIAVSRSTKKDILHFYPKINSDKINVIYHGIDVEKFQTPNDKYQINSKLQIPSSGFILYLGAIQPRKNLGVLIEAFEKIKREKDRRDLGLVLAGGAAWMADETLKRAKASDFARDIFLLGQVSFKEAVELYNRAEIFVLPSLYEGFGMSILEAWASGLPIIVADNSSLTEIGGEAVEKFQTGQAEDLANKLNLLLRDENRKIELREKGYQRLKNFSWEKCARETLKTLKFA
jgi:glycosyltransferase involved in cell wall biosynthesis